MKLCKFGASLVGVILLGAVPSTGCVADRPARNGVFNENQYVRKDFLIQGTDANGNAAGTDPGWLVRATVMETSTPNLLGPNMNVWGGAQSYINQVRFRVTQDKLQLLSMVQLSAPVNPAGIPDETGVTAAVVNAWPATNVDLKYRVNLDGETTNFYEENQELDWEVRQWVKLQFDKNDFSDLQPLGPETWSLISQCADVADASATLVDGSFLIDQGDPTTINDDYMEFTVQVSLPMLVGNATCNTIYGPALLDANLLGPAGADSRSNYNVVTANLKYSFKRATPLASPAATYKPWIMAEKDPIQRKYGPFLPTVFNRDNTTGLLAANEFVGRFDPAKPIVWYFDETFPENYKCAFRTGPKCPAVNTGSNPAAVTIEDGTNAVLKASGAAARVSFLDYNAPDPKTNAAVNRQYGDIRYNMLRWESDQDVQDAFVAVTMPGFDPRTGEIINEGMMFNDFALKDFFVTRVDAFLTSIGDGLSDTTPKGSCTDGQTLPLVDATVIDNHNFSSTLFKKMQTYLAPSAPMGSHLGPADFVPTRAEDPDFLHAYFALAPYELFADPAMNQFVTPEGGTGVYGPADVFQHFQDETTFQQLAATIDSGKQPFENGVTSSVAFVNQMRTLTTSHDDLARMKGFIYPAQYKDALGAFSFETVMQHDARRCMNGAWESPASWTQGIIDAYWQQTFWHEFGHSMGLEHNFMGSVDQPNFTPRLDPKTNAPLTDVNGNPEYGLYSSSIMDYFANPADGFWTQGWGKYDAAAIAWIYANNGTQPDNPALDTAIKTANPLSGQANATYPYKDPLGFCAAGDSSCTQGQEHQFLRCDEHHLKYSPLCREFDLGVTPSQIIANAIEDYEWQFPWRNNRSYHKVWDLSNYASGVENTITELRRFLSQWYYDWSPGDLTTTLHRIGITQPVSAGAVSSNDYYTQLTNKFLTEMSAANQMMAAFDEALIQQASDERPYATVYDTYYGDETQQGIILDKYFAMQQFVGLWIGDNYDQNQAAGAYLSSWGSFDFDFPSASGTGTPFDNSYESVAETTVTSMIGSQYSVYPYFIPTAVALFAQDTHNPSFLSAGDPGTRVEAKEWIGGWTFSRLQDLIDYFKNIAVQAAYTPTVPLASAATAATSAQNAQNNAANGVCSAQLNSYQAAGQCAGVGSGCAGLAACCPTLGGAAAAGCAAVVASNDPGNSACAAQTTSYQTAAAAATPPIVLPAACTSQGSDCANLATCCAALDALGPMNPAAPFAATCDGIVLTSANPAPVITPTVCTSITNCAYDPTDPSQVTLDANDGHFVAPDGLTYVWAYLPERAQWIVARQDRNIVTWRVVTQYNSDLLTQHDDGSMNNTYDLEYQIMYTIDAYNEYEYNQADTATSSASATSTGSGS